MADEHKIHAYGKTVKEIADEIGVSKQAVFKRINRQPLSTKLERLTSTVDGRLMVSVDGEMLIKQAFGAENHKKEDKYSAYMLLAKSAETPRIKILFLEKALIEVMSQDESFYTKYQDTLNVCSQLMVLYDLLGDAEQARRIKRLREKTLKLLN